MKCTHCGSNELNRILLDKEKMSVLGCICEDCEDGLRSGEISPGEVVNYLDTVEYAEPRFALPFVDLILSDPDEGEFYIEYTMDSSTPYLKEIVLGESNGKTHHSYWASG